MNGTYSDTELEDMLVDIESELCERKESLGGDAPKRIRQTICAFANDLPDHRRPGVVFLGATDRGVPTGLKITDRMLQQLSDIKTDGNTLPPPTISVTKRTLKGQAVAVVTVQPSDSPPVRYRGQIWVRIGPRLAPATAQDERILNEKRRTRDPHFDAFTVPTATIDDLDLVRFETEYLPQAFDHRVLAANERSAEERLAALKMIGSLDNPTPTVTGLLVLGKHPQDFLPGAYMQFLRIGGSEWGDPVVDEERCDGPILDQVTRLDGKLNSHNRTMVDFTSGPREIRRSTYPLEALRQLVRNAVMHRTYEGTSSQVLVYWFDDHIEIVSPGTPVGGISAEKLGQPGLVAYRNPNLAEAMKVLGLVQGFGVGIATARRELEANGQHPPEFLVEEDRVFCKLRERP